MLSRGEGRVQCLPRAAAWDLAGMDVATLARGQAVNRAQAFADAADLVVAR
jgi:hypothetical protein